MRTFREAINDRSDKTSTERFRDIYLDIRLNRGGTFCCDSCLDPLASLGRGRKTLSPTMRVANKP